MTEPNPLSVFLAHAKEDKPLVLEIYHLLRLDGFLPWVDKENLVPGHHWELEIQKAVRASNVVIARNYVANTPKLRVRPLELSRQSKVRGIYGIVLVQAVHLLCQRNPTPRHAQHDRLRFTRDIGLG
jgi:hypothetical protein